MKFPPVRLGALVVCLALSHHAAANDDVNAVTLASGFMQALQQQRYQDAAAMFTPEVANGAAATTDGLKRLDQQVGGLSTIRNILSMPAGTSVRLAIPAGADPTVKTKKFFQVRYTATAVDGKPVVYVLDIDGERRPQRVLAFSVHMPTPDAESTQRAQAIASKFDAAAR